MECILAVFRSRAQALDCASRLRKLGICADIVSTPREANVGCGLSLRLRAGDVRARECVRRAGYSAFVGFFCTDRRGTWRI